MLDQGRNLTRLWFIYHTLPIKNTNGLALVDISRVIYVSCFIIGSSSAHIGTLTIRNIGSNNAYEKSKYVIEGMEIKADMSHIYYNNKATQLDIYSSDNIRWLHILHDWYRYQSYMNI